MLTRFWFEFEGDGDLPIGLGHGCGVSAYNYDDAVALLKENVFAGKELRGVATVTADIDISELDDRHVWPNMANPLERGVWFPLGYA
jgi:hypothetical protein